MVEVVGTAPTSAMVITKFVYRRSWKTNIINIDFKNKFSRQIKTMSKNFFFIIWSNPWLYLTLVPIAKILSKKNYKVYIFCQKDFLNKTKIKNKNIIFIYSIQKFMKICFDVSKMIKIVIIINQTNFFINFF